MYISEDRITDVQGDERNPVNTGRLCARASSFVPGLGSPLRVAKVSGRNSFREDFQEIDNWETGLDLLAERLKRIREQHGAQSLFIACDPRSGLDFYAAAMRFAALWGTSYLYQPFQEPLQRLPDQIPNVPHGSCSSWIDAKCLLLVGTDLASTHPIAFRWALEAQARGAALVVADTRFTSTMAKADAALLIRPESGSILGMALMKVALDNDFCSSEAVESRFLNAEAWKSSFDGLSLDDAAKAVGVTVDNLKEVGRLLFKKGPGRIITGKTLARLSGYGIWRTLAVAVGWTENQRGGWYPLDSGDPPIHACADTGTPDWRSAFAGTQADVYSLIRDLLETGEGTCSPPIKAVINSGDCLGGMLSGLGARDDRQLVAHFTPVLNDVSNGSHMIFPASMWPERNGIFFTNDRHVRWGEKVVEPPGESRNGLDFWSGLAARFGWDEYFPWSDKEGTTDVRAFSAWLLDQGPFTKGYPTGFLESCADPCRHFSWALQAKDSGDLLGCEAPAGGKIPPAPAETPPARSPVEQAEAEQFPLYLEYSSVDCGTDSSGTAWPLSRNAEQFPLLQVNPRTAHALRIQTRDEVLVHSPRRIVQATAWVTRMVPPNLVFSQSGWGDHNVVIYKKGTTIDDALNILRGVLE